MARKNENSVAACRDRPNSMPPIIVAPEREVPGISAKACAQPIFSASVQESSSTLRMRTRSGLLRCRRSAQRMTSAPAMNAPATGTGANRRALIAPAKASPSSAAGRKAIRRFSTKRCAARSRGSPRATAKSLARYSQQTATMAPAWMTISNSFARSPVKFSSDPATIRWPVEDTGRNSVRPSTRPRIAATSRSNAVIACACGKKDGRLAPPGFEHAKDPAPRSNWRDRTLPIVRLVSGASGHLPAARAGARLRRRRRRQNVVDGRDFAGVRRAVTGQASNQLATGRASEIVDQRDHARIGQVIATQRQAVPLGCQRHEIEPVLRRGGLDAESDIGLSGGDRRRDREMRELLLLVPDDARRIDLRRAQQTIEQQARSRRRLTVDQARTAGKIGQRADTEWISRPQQKALASLGKQDDRVPMSVEPLTIGCGEVGAAAAVDVEAGKLAALGDHRVDAVDAAAKLHVELQAAGIVERVADGSECQVVA